MEYGKNKRGWKPSETDYQLIFREIDGYWREITGSIAKYNNLILADYLSAIDCALPVGTQFCRVRRGQEHIEIRDFGSYVRIDYKLMPEA